MRCLPVPDEPPCWYVNSAQGIAVQRILPNCSYNIQVVDINHFYSPVANDEYLRINITITNIYRLTARIWDVSNDFQNKHFCINEKVCFSLPPYNMDWFEQYYPIFPQWIRCSIFSPID